MNRDLGSRPAFRNGPAPRHPLGKRVFDVLGASLGLAIAAPLMGLIAAAVRLGSRGPALFIQERTGRGGRPFRVYKFRTMTVAAPGSTEPRAEATADDPRITRLGRLLRRTGLDELPQLWNVLRGEMSLVGPRPLLAWENELCDDRQARRLLVRPGITGLSQVKGRNAIPWAERIEWDLRYVEAASLGLDLWVLLRTIPTALFGQDAYAGPDATAGRGADDRPGARDARPPVRRGVAAY